MKIHKKDIPSLIGLFATTSLVAISEGVINSAAAILTVGGSIGANLAANYFTSIKFRKWLTNDDPDKLNHHIKKLFIESVNEALDKIQFLFFKTNYTDVEKKEARQLIKTLQKHLPKMLADDQQIQLGEYEVKHFLYEKDKEDDICNFINNQFGDFGITEPFKSFLAQNLPSQIQLCFGEGLKDHAHRNAWIAFQRMLTEEIRYDIKQLVKDQQSIKEDLSDLKFEKSGFSEEQIAEVRQLIKILNDKKLVEVKIKSGINQSLKSIESKANEIIRITTKTQLTVDELKTIVEKIKRQNRINHIIIYAFAACLLIFVGVFMFYNFKNQPFTVTIQVVDWNNRTDNPEIYSKGGIISFDGKKEYDNELTITNEGKFNLNLPVSYKNQSVRVYLKEKMYEYMKLDTTIVVHENSTYYLKMSFSGIDKITRTVINGNTNEPFRNAIVEINGVKDTTDINGTFTITLPLEKQKHIQKLTIKKDGYEDFVNNKFDMTVNNSHILWNFSKK